MKILSWNLKRPTNSIDSEKNAFIINLVEQAGADIIILTETNSAINFKNYHSYESLSLPAFHENQKYNTGENRVALFSRYPISRHIATYDPYTAICCEVVSPFGEIVIYGSIIGSFGGHGEHFTHDIECQKAEIAALSAKHQLIYSGDFNIAFSGHPYPSKKVIADMSAFFQDHQLDNITKENTNCALHIVASRQLLEKKRFVQQMVSIDPKISDHNMVIAEIIYGK